MSPHLTPMERLRQSGVTPDRALGQNFLIDPNIIDVIDRTAGLKKDDVVLEVGPGLGVLTERLVARCGVVHCVEVDPGLAEMIADEFGSLQGFSLYRSDALAMDLRAFVPAPNKFVANLPYNIAAPLVIKSLEESPSLDLWCLMLQKEIADRLFARPGSAGYGGISVMTQLMAGKISSRPVSGSVFHPRPRVRSSLLAFKRRRPAGFTAGHFQVVQAVVRSSFSHRRKMLVNSMADADINLLPPGLAALEPGRRKQVIADTLLKAGLPVHTRPQALTPAQYEMFAIAIDALSGGGNA